MRRRLFVILANPVTLTLLSVCVMALAIKAGFTHFAALDDTRLGTQELAQDLTVAEDIAVILVALGVLLEERGLFSAKVYGENPPPGDHELNEFSETYGAILLVVGLLMEVHDQVSDPLLTNAGLDHVSVAIMLLFDAMAVAASIRYIFKFARQRTTR